jgi:hypothetical protein
LLLSIVHPIFCISHTVSVVKYRMGGNDKQSGGGGSAPPEQWQRCQRQRTSSAKRSAQQVYSSIPMVSTTLSATSSTERQARAPPPSSAGPQLDRSSTSAEKSASGRKVQPQPTGARGSQAQPIDSIEQHTRRLATSRDSSSARGKTQQQSTRGKTQQQSARGKTQEQSARASGSQLQRTGSAKPQITSPAASTKIPRAETVLPPHRTDAGSSQTCCRPSTQRLVSVPATGRETGAQSQRKADRSIDADGLQFSPKLVNDEFPVPVARNVPWPRFRHKAAKIGIGIESEFLLRPRRRPTVPITSVSDFGAIVAYDHNVQVPAHLPRMYSYMENQEISQRGDQVEKEARGFDEWSLTFDGTMYTSEEPCKPPLFNLIPKTGYVRHNYD